MFEKYKINKKYVSPIDLILAEFNRTHAKSQAQLAEIQKYKRIYQLRDYPTEEVTPPDIWSV
jgi:hypothetical protein